MCVETLPPLLLLSLLLLLLLLTLLTLLLLLLRILQEEVNQRSPKPTSPRRWSNGSEFASQGRRVVGGASLPAASPTNLKVSE